MPREAGLFALGEGVIEGTYGRRDGDLRPGAPAGGVDDPGARVVEDESSGVVPGHAREVYWDDVGRQSCPTVTSDIYDKVRRLSRR